MNKDIIIIILVVALVLAAGTSIFLAQRGPVVVGGQAQKELCGIIPSLSGGLPGTSDAPPSIAQDMCYLVFAYEKDDVAICKKIKIPDFQGSCFSAMAVKTQNSSLCEEAPALARDRCFSDVANELNEGTALCEKIKDQNQKDNCLANYASRTKDSAVCRKISRQDARDSCFINSAFSANDYSLCSQISNPDMKRDCQSRLSQ